MPPMKFEYCRRILGHMQNGLSPWLRALGGVDWWKKPRVENLVQLSLLVNFSLFFKKRWLVMEKVEAGGGARAASIFLSVVA
jgi:hypothetical protein